jgi:hypothetical protein
MQNVPLFEKLNWQPLGHQECHGHPHMKMQADLAAYPPVLNPARGWMALTRRAA